MIVKSNLSRIGLMVAVFVMVTTGAGFTAEKKLLKMGYIAPVQVWEYVAKKYSEEVGKRASTLEVKWFGGGQLGNPKQMLAALKRGKMELMLADTGTLPQTAGGKDFNVLFAPFLFNSQEHLYKYLDSDLFNSMLAKVEKIGGLKYLGYVGDRPSRMLTTSNRKVVKPEDLDGLKLRVPMVRSIKTFFEEMGAAPTPIPGAELYMALKQGVVDGQDNGWDAIVKASFYEVQNYVIETNYVRQGFIILGSAKTWNSLSKTEQKAILDAAIPTAEFVTEESNKIVASGKKFVEEKGVTVVEPDLKAFRSASVKVIQEKLDGKDWAAGLYDKIQAID